MPKITIHKHFTKKCWNADKQISVSVDGNPYKMYWDCSIEHVFKDVKRRLGIRRAHLKVV